MYANHEWIRFYEAAALETDVTILPKKIEAAEHAISQRVMATQIDDSERQAMFMALCALMALWHRRCNCDNPCATTVEMKAISSVR